MLCGMGSEAVPLSPVHKSEAFFLDPACARMHGRDARATKQSSIFLISSGVPPPIANTRHILSMLSDVRLVFEELVLQILLQIRRLGAELGEAIDDIAGQVKSV